MGLLKLVIPNLYDALDFIDVAAQFKYNSTSKCISISYTYKSGSDGHVTIMDIFQDGSQIVFRDYISGSQKWRKVINL